MPYETKYLFMVTMDVTAEQEALFNEVYDTEHVPYLSRVPGVRSVSRLKLVDAPTTFGGALGSKADGVSATYMAVYEIDDPAVLTSDAWSAESEKGRWASEVRPHTTNRRHEIREVMTPGS